MKRLSLAETLRDIDPTGQNPAIEVINDFNSLGWKAIWLLCAVAFCLILIALGLVYLFLDGSSLGASLASFVGAVAIIATGFRFFRALAPLKKNAFHLFTVVNNLSRDRRIKINETDFIKLIAGQEVSRDGVTLILADIGTRRIAAAVQFQLLAEQRTNLKRPWLGSPNYQGG